MDLSSTIVALSTAPGRSARAVVRMSGAGVFEVLEGVLALDLDGGVEPRAEGHEDSAPPSPLRGSADKGDRGPRAGSDAPMRGLRKRGVYVARMRLAGIGAEPAAGAALPAAAVSQASVEATAGADLPADVEIPAGAELPVLVVSLPGPRSYTGEDSVEILLPGSPALVDLVLEELLALPGVRAAEPGEFSARAYLNGRLSLEQAEGVAQRIAAESGAQLGAADRLLSGEAGQEEAAWARRLARALALVEAGVDFTDQEDVHPISAPDLRAQLEALQSEIDARLGGRHAREAADALPLVALVGRPNAGKSTLLNALLGRQRAVTSPEPGATRDALAETIDLSADAPLAGEVMLVDLPGLEAAPEVGATGAASEAQQNLLGTLERADALIWCDPAARFDVDELPAAAGALRAAPVIRVRTMADLGGIGLSRDGGTQATSEGCGVSGDSGAGPAAHVPICALDGFGLSDLRRAIARAIGAGSRGGEAVLLAPRRRRALVEARAGLHNALAALHEGPAAGSIGAPEVVAAEMRAALDALGALTGQISPDEVLGEVFRSFCVGK